MLSSLPMITPHDAHALWYTSSSSTTPPNNNHNNNNNNNNNGGTPFSDPSQPPHQQSHQNHTNRRHPLTPHHTPLAQLLTSETHIATRKLHIQRFGSTWIRPPGVPKTYQAMMDEAAEREEQEMVAQRELAAFEAQQAAEDEEAMAEGEGVGAGPEGLVDQGGMMGREVRGWGEGVERDLDEDVPEAEDEEGTFLEEGEEEGESEEGEMMIQEGDVTGEIDEGLAGAEEEESAFLLNDDGMGAERDLDEDVPEAGSYQHTDTEVEDESSDGDGWSHAGGGSGNARGSGLGLGRLGGGRVSMVRSDGSSVLLGSSVMGSSPVGGDGRRGGIFGRRLGGREN
ncbi:MAG: hypothetical protein M1827_003449 [Pycnora praestabilis]|nr:MAG: hypothetical protein M1827_003449 [Pycnora praestabilis]